MEHLRCPVYILLLIFIASAGLEAAEKTKLTPAQRSEAAVMLGEFRKLKPGAERRAELITSAVALGVPAIRPLLDMAEKELIRPLDQYRTKFSRGAAKAFSAKLKRNSAAEVEQLRIAVLAQSRAEQLSKEDITRVADPAVKRLKEILLVSNEEVFAQDATLADLRSTLIASAVDWERCRLELHNLEPAPSTENNAAENQVPPSFADFLSFEEELAVFEITPIDPVAKAVLAENAKLASRLDPEEVRCIQQCNLIRCMLGLSAVRIDLQLCAASRAHSEDMDRLNFFDHSSPITGKTSPWDRAKLAGTSASAENIARGQRDGSAANQAWWYSPGHHKNMLGNHLRIGLGRHDVTWTEMFGG
jgi:uncharacterized protein YkwD